MAAPFFTPVRRNHIVGPAGVGSILVTRSGVTAVVCGLPEWIERAPARGNEPQARRADQQRLLEAHQLHDSNAERDLGVARFISPPPVDDEPAYGKTWFIPAVRFPLAEYCHNPSCQRVGYSSPESPSVGRCSECTTPKRSSRRQQVPIVLVCPSGHLDEVDLYAQVHPNGRCFEPQLAYRSGLSITAPEIKCLSCGSHARINPREPVACTGARPWLPSKSREQCSEQMHVLDRTSTATFFSDVRSYLHIPVEGHLRDAVLRWLESDPVASVLRRADTAETRVLILERIRPYYPDITEASLAEHLAFLSAPRAAEQGRVGELEALTSGKRNAHTDDGPPILDAETISAARFNPAYVGPSAPISGVVAVRRLAETRVLAGFTRMTPPSRALTGAPGFAHMWGEKQGATPGHDWLPGMRVYGEGILLELNPIRVGPWSRQAAAHLATRTFHGEALTPAFEVAHTLAHLLMNAAALQCGYPVASLRDRIYDLPGRTALLIYTGEGDVLGTMGGLVELAQPGHLEPLLEEAYAHARWCGLDPVCLDPVQHLRDARAGACHQCCLLPETSCGWWNEGLDRATLIGRVGGLKGFLQADN